MRKKHKYGKQETWIKRLEDACNVYKRCGYMPWVLEKTGSFILIEWEVKKSENTVNARFTQGLMQLIFTFFG